MSREEHEYTFWTDIFGTDAKGQPIKVEGKDHYKRLMAASGSVPLEEAQAIAYEANKGYQNQDYKTSPELEELLREVRSTADKNGNVRLGGRVLDRMEELGISTGREVPEYLKEAALEGGIHSE